MWAVRLRPLARANHHSTGIMAASLPSYNLTLSSRRNATTTVGPAVTPVAATAAPVAATATPETPVVASAATAATPPVEPVVHKGVMWFDSVFPILTWQYDPRKLFRRQNHRQVLPPLLPEGVEVKKWIPRHREGGVFCHVESKTDDIDTIVRQTQLALASSDLMAPLTLRPRPITVHQVKGTPFLEDLTARFPSVKLRVELRGGGGELPIETVYSQFRVYGRLHDILVVPPAKGADLGVINMTFRGIEGAVGARNCLHRFKINDTTFHINYEDLMRTSYIVDFFTKNPRIVIPIFAFLIASGTFLIFDPLRSFFVKNNITGDFQVFGKNSFQWVKDQAVAMTSAVARTVGLGKEDHRHTVTWDARREDEERLQRWLAKVPDRLLFVAGPKGAGKLSLVTSATSGRKNMVVVDVGQFIDKDDQEFVAGLCSSMGFFPGFKLITTVSNMMDLVTPGMSKAAPNHASTQVPKVLEVVATALQSLQKDRKSGDDLPLFVFEGFTDDNKVKHGALHIFCKWAADMTEQHLARVIFLTDSALEDGVAKAIPSLKTEAITLSDASHQSAVQFVEGSAGKPLDSAGIDALKILGGRYTDLDGLVRAMEGGAQVPEAVEEIVGHAVNQVRHHLFTPPDDTKSARWSRGQLWQVMKLIGESPTGDQSYDHVLFNVFKGDDVTLKSLVRADIVRVIKGEPGHTDRIRAGSPVYLEAYKRFLQDPKLRPGLDLVVTKTSYDTEMVKMVAYEDELVKLSEIISSYEASRTSGVALPTLGLWSHEGKQVSGVTGPDGNVQLVKASAPTGAPKGTTDVLWPLYRRRDFLLMAIDEAHANIALLEASRRKAESLVKQINLPPAATAAAAAIAP